MSSNHYYTYNNGNSKVATHKIFGFSWTKMSSQLCSFNYYSCIVQFFENDEKNMEFLCSHGVLPATVTCPHMALSKKISVPKSKKTTCSFTISDFKGSFMHNNNIRLVKSCYLLTTTSAISGTTGLCWNA